jgi:hypothetical protein
MSAETEPESGVKPPAKPVAPSFLAGTIEPFFVAHWDVVVAAIAAVASLSGLPLAMRGPAFAVYTLSLVRWCRSGGTAAVPAPAST